MNAKKILELQSMSKQYTREEMLTLNSEQEDMIQSLFIVPISSYDYDEEQEEMVAKYH